MVVHSPPKLEIVHSQGAPAASSGAQGLAPPVSQNSGDVPPSLAAAAWAATAAANSTGEADLLGPDPNDKRGFAAWNTIRTQAVLHSEEKKKEDVQVNVNTRNNVGVGLTPAAGNAGEDDIPVSYTHLTLPTIYSV